MTMTSKKKKIAIVWRGDREARDEATLETGRFSGIADALAKVGIASAAVVYDETFADEVRESLLSVDGVLVFVNPIDSGRDRTQIDRMLREVAREGILVSAHPDVILKMGTKQVLFETREMGWGCDTHLYTTVEGFRDAFPWRLTEGKARVLKQYRGNGGSGVWRVSASSELNEDSLQATPPGEDDVIFVRHAQRGSVEEAVTLGSFFDRCKPYFEGSGQLIDQAF
jgi:glutathione synthase/RimK-type ligase-like ATP-grasp enzyme